ncbi:hypothetical protein GCM10011328_42650 [Hafnia psychrotolerans]|uniref:Uncharacterized protein n=1 Tax=Hafnia psychrotolerans TaxID=1477018 RepID=A0ABQ1H934_9GAMM|nr:hypothetical protein GCM10011328_42650 [Hafnia psychrotolerans]
MTFRRTNPGKKIPAKYRRDATIEVNTGGHYEIFRKVKTGTGLPANGGGFVGLADAEQLLF